MRALLEKAQFQATRTAIIANGRAYTYQTLLDASAKAAAQLLGDKASLNGERVAFMVNPGFDYVKVQWAIWRAGGVAVPLSLHSPLPAIAYVLEDAACTYLIADEEYASLLAPLNSADDHYFFHSHELTGAEKVLPVVDRDSNAMIIYTSGTTGKPKGVVTTHAIIASQIETLGKAWQWTEEDHILNVLPMHHVHGLVNVLLCALWSGACCEFARFDAPEVMEKLSAGRINLFMAVPTIYYKLIDHWKGLNDDHQKDVHKALNRFRLMVSGSAALPVSVMESWEQISGHRLLERYGMTEIGMAISNPYASERRAGHIGQPLPGVDLKLADEKNEEVTTGQVGEIYVKGPNVFKEYWNKPEATQAAFTKDGWFKTGDMAVFNEGSYRIMGRSSVDIIKSGGYKISALEIEEVIRTHPAIADCAVVGLPDEEWDEIVAAGIVLVNGEEIDEATLIAWLKERLPAYQLPRRFLKLDALPRNAMGKVTKPALKERFQ